jgi:heme/copper-type cytochrome/quinol oxidase subunit 2
MKSVSGVLMSLMLNCPLLYQGFVMPEQNQKFETPKIGVSAGWILLFICIPVLVLVYILLWKDGRFHKSKRMDHK